MSNEPKQKRRSVFDDRLEKYYDELKWLYMELYNDEEAFEYFLNMLRRSFKERKSSLRSEAGNRQSAENSRNDNNMAHMGADTGLSAQGSTGILHALRSVFTGVSVCHAL